MIRSERLKQASALFNAVLKLEPSDEATQFYWTCDGVAYTVLKGRSNMVYVRHSNPKLEGLFEGPCPVDLSKARYTSGNGIYVSKDKCWPYKPTRAGFDLDSVFRLMLTGYPEFPMDCDWNGVVTTQSRVHFFRWDGSRPANWCRSLWKKSPVKLNPTVMYISSSVYNVIGSVMGRRPDSLGVNPTERCVPVFNFKWDDGVIGVITCSAVPSETSDMIKYYRNLLLSGAQRYIVKDIKKLKYKELLEESKMTESIFNSCAADVLAAIGVKPVNRPEATITPDAASEPAVVNAAPTYARLKEKSPAVKAPEVKPAVTPIPASTPTLAPEPVIKPVSAPVVRQPEPAPVAAEDSVVEGQPAQDQGAEQRSVDDYFEAVITESQKTVDTLKHIIKETQTQIKVLRNIRKDIKNNREANQLRKQLKDAAADVEAFAKLKAQLKALGL